MAILSTNVNSSVFVVRARNFRTIQKLNYGIQKYKNFFIAQTAQMIFLNDAGVPNYDSFD